MSKSRHSRYFGWYIVGVATLITTLTVGFRLGIGPFVKPILADLEMTRTTFSFIVAVSMIVYGLGMPLAGYLSNRFSTRFVLLLGLFIICLSILWTVSTENILSFFAAYGIFLSLGLSFTSPVAVTPVISRWFTRQRGRALFFLSTGSMAGIAIFNPLETFLIEWIGWQHTLLFFAVLFMLIVVPSAIFVIRDEPPAGTDQLETVRAGLTQSVETELVIGWKEAVKTGPFWQIVIGLFACGFSMNLLGSHAVPMLMDHHFEAHTASFGVGLIGLVAIFSSLAMGSVADRFARKNILFWIYIIRGLGFLGLVFAVTPLQLYLVAATGGLVWSGSIALSSAILGDLYGVRLLGILYGWAYFAHQIGAAIGSFLGGWGFEKFGTHLLSFGMTTILLILAGWVSYRLPKQISLTQVSSEKKSIQAG